MTLYDPIQGAAAIRRTAKKNFFELWISILEQEPEASFDDRLEKWTSIVEDDRDYLNAIFRYTAKRIEADITAKRRSTRAQPRRSEKEIRAAVSEMKRQATSAILDARLPSGKTIRQSTFGELTQFGGVCSKLATMGKPHEIVGDKISDAKADRIWKQMLKDRGK